MPTHFQRFLVLDQLKKFASRQKLVNLRNCDPRTPGFVALNGNKYPSVSILSYSGTGSYAMASTQTRPLIGRSGIVPPSGLLLSRYTGLCPILSENCTFFPMYLFLARQCIWSYPARSPPPQQRVARVDQRLHAFCFFLGTWHQQNRPRFSLLRCTMTTHPNRQSDDTAFALRYAQLDKEPYLQVERFCSCPHHNTEHKSQVSIRIKEPHVVHGPSNIFSRLSSPHKPA